MSEISDISIKQAVAARALYDAIWIDRNAAKMSEILDDFPKLLNAVIDEDWKATALHCAAGKGLTEAVQDLLQRKGVEIDKRNKIGCTALYYGCFSGHVDVVKVLLEHKANTNIARTVCPVL